jgi:acyl-CoA thioesterase
VTGGWLRLAEPQVADGPVIAAYTDAWIPAVFPRLTTPLPVPTIDLTIHFRSRLPHPGLGADDAVLARFTTREARDGFVEEDGELWAPDGTLLAHSRQLAILMP